LNIVGDYKTACGTLLVTLLFPTSLLGLGEYYNTNSLAVVTGLILTVTMTIGGYYGALFSNYVTYGRLEIISGIIFIIVGIHYLFMGFHSLYTKEIRNKTIWF
jgi:putative Mn2+ efflux pump MntP